MKTEDSLLNGVDCFADALSRVFGVYKDEKTGGVKLSGFNKMLKDSQLEGIISRSSTDLIFSKCKNINNNCSS